MTDPFIGELKMVSFNYAPRGWAFCNGQLLAIQQNQALFSLLGTQYGGNGTTNFALPDLRSRAPLGYGQGPGLSNYVIGQVGGTETVTLLSTQIPQHTHILAGDTTVAATSNAAVPAAGNSLGAGIGIPPTGDPFALNIYGTAGGATAPQAAATIGNFGGSQGHENRQPYLVLNWIIALQGIFPSRN
jgi:microcystin-dependent protein